MTRMAEKWTYGYCETCMKNAHEKVKMIKSNFASGNPNDTQVKEMWVCPKCGSSKEF
jgi:rubredoxin